MCLGSGSGSLRILTKFNRLDSDPHWECGSGSWSRRPKMTNKNWKKCKNFMFWRAGCSLFDGWRLLCSLDVFFRLSLSKLHFLIIVIKIVHVHTVSYRMIVRIQVHCSWFTAKFPFEFLGWYNLSNYTRHTETQECFHIPPSEEGTISVLSVVGFSFSSVFRIVCS